MKKITIEEHGCSFGTALDHYKRGSLIKVPEWKNKGLSLDDGDMVMTYINDSNKDTVDFDLAHHVHREDWQVCEVVPEEEVLDMAKYSFRNQPHFPFFTQPEERTVRLDPDIIAMAHMGSEHAKRVINDIEDTVNNPKWTEAEMLSKLVYSTKLWTKPIPTLTKEEHEELFYIRDYVADYLNKLKMVEPNPLVPDERDLLIELLAIHKSWETKDGANKFHENLYKLIAKVRDFLQSDHH